MSSPCAHGVCRDFCPAGQQALRFRPPSCLLALLGVWARMAALGMADFLLLASLGMAALCLGIFIGGIIGYKVAVRWGPWAAPPTAPSTAPAASPTPSPTAAAAPSSAARAAPSMDQSMDSQDEIFVSPWGRRWHVSGTCRGLDLARSRPQVRTACPFCARGCTVVPCVGRAS